MPIKVQTFLLESFKDSEELARQVLELSYQGKDIEPC